ncbi:pentapeptide repeat-containing protein [Kitasatospora sp. NPDC048540]|uniref:pentapeptide repeat-containing protein n=1 Tax=Kitasatospora sp. NPDC048540 TaxID=3155634 RepID=UPI003403B4A4
MWIVAGLAVTVVCVAGIGAYWLVSHLTEGAADASNPADAIRLTLAILTVIGAVLTGVYAYRKQRIAEGDAHRADATQFAERYSTAAGQLGHETPAVRLAGVYAMTQLADDWDEQRQVCIDVLCAYLRMPYEWDPESDKYRKGEREVRHTIIRVIRDHLQGSQERRSWSGFTLDFTRATFDGGDFSDSHFRGNVSFSDTEFIGDSFSFDGARFSDGVVDFRGARFDIGTISFDRARFDGGTVDFGQARFSSGILALRGAVFDPSGIATFHHAQFSGGTVDLDDAQLNGGTVDFRYAQFSNSTVNLNRAVCADGSLAFNRAHFTGGTTSFDHAQFSGGAVALDDAEFTDSTVSFYATRFTGGTLTFDYGQFTGSTVTFHHARFVGGGVALGHARFTGGTLSFVRAQVTEGVLTCDEAQFSDVSIRWGRVRPQEGWTA